MSGTEIMKTKAILMILITLFLAVGMGCEDESINYQGKIISLNSGACYNIIQIDKSIPQGLPISTTITFDPNLYNGQLKIGDIVYFKIIKYEAWTGIVIAMCTAPQYVGQLEFYNKQNIKL